MTSSYYYNLGERPNNEKPPSKWWVWIAMGILAATVCVIILWVRQ